MLLDIIKILFGKFVPDCVRSYLRGSKFKIFLGGGGCPQTPLVGMHTYACVSVPSHTTIILLPSCFLPQFKILYETLIGIVALAANMEKLQNH